MSDKPILFSGPMVRAILEGRKTQTRRILKLGRFRPEYIGPKGCTDDPSCWGWPDDERGDHWLVKRGVGDNGYLEWSDSRGAYRVGDRLWVRETWQGLSFGDYLPTKSNVCDLRYRATDPLGEVDKDVRGYPWRPSIHMPRWASRLTLIVEDVRVERLQDISEDDAIDEGCRPFFDECDPHILIGPNGTSHEMRPLKGPQDDFKRLWDSLNAKRAPWASNPWVVAVTFRAVQANIDRMEAGQ